MSKQDAAVDFSKLAQQLMACPDWGIRARAQQIQDRLYLPMADVLAKVPGPNVKEKCKRIGICRPTYYYWLRGVNRPNTRQAKKLARLTGYSVKEIQGSFSIPPSKSAALAPGAASGV